MKKRLESGLFKLVVANTPLISIDFIVKNNKGQVLLGQRLNRPAYNFWFVPGGRVFKDETFSEAFDRISQHEFGRVFTIDAAEFYGVYEHFYKDNFFNEDFTTHYIVHGYMITVAKDDLVLPYEQHSSFRWFSIDELLSNSAVHQYTKNYFLARQ